MTWDVPVIGVGMAALAAFVIAFACSGLVRRAAAAVGTARGALAVIADARLTDDEKEPRVRQAALDLFGSFAQITVRGVAVLAVAAAPVGLAAGLGLAPAAAVAGFLASWPVILGASAVMVAAWLIAKRR